MVRKSGNSRRRFIQRASAIGALVVLSPLSGCGRREGQGNDDAVEGRRAEESDPCAELTGLTEEQRSFRDDADYLAETPVPEERCDNCEYWEPPKAGAQCGGCTVIDGPIHPGGYCDLWEEQS